MSRAKGLLKRFMHELTKEELCSVPDELQAEIKELLAQPEQESVYQKLSRIEDGIEVEILPSELWQDGYETGKRSVLLSKQPEQEPVAWMYDHQIEVGYDKYTEVNIIETCARNLESNNCINIRPLYLAPPKQEPLSVERIADLWTDINTNSVRNFARAIEKEHGIGGGE